MMIRLLLVDDQLLVRQGLKVLLEVQADFAVVGEAENGQEAIAQVSRVCPDVVLMDVRMPELDGVSATQQILQQFPATKVLMLSTFDDDPYVIQALRCGAKGYLLKDISSEDLVGAIRNVNKGYTQLAPGLIEKAIAPLLPIRLTTALPPQLAQLTPRERQILCLMITGSSNRQIAKTLYITEGTVKNHITHILKRMQVGDRIQATLFASDYLSLLNQEL
jgi:DNA-binding NarL/FixJ family response regulator